MKRVSRLSILVFSVVTLLLVCWSLVPGSMQAAPQEPSAPPNSANSPTDEPSKGDAKAKDEAKPEAAIAKDNVKKDTPGAFIKPAQGLHLNVDLALVNVSPVLTVSSFPNATVSPASAEGRLVS